MRAIHKFKYDFDDNKNNISMALVEKLLFLLVVIYVLTPTPLRFTLKRN